MDPCEPLMCSFSVSRVIRVNRKSEKSEHKLLQPTSSVSHKQPSHGRRTPQPLTLIQILPPIYLKTVSALQTSPLLTRHLLHPRIQLLRSEPKAALKGHRLTRFISPMSLKFVKKFDTCIDPLDTLLL